MTATMTAPTTALMHATTMQTRAPRTSVRPALPRRAGRAIAGRTMVRAAVNTGSNNQDGFVQVCTLGGLRARPCLFSPVFVKHTYSLFSPPGVRTMCSPPLCVDHPSSSHSLPTRLACPPRRASLAFAPLQSSGVAALP